MRIILLLGALLISLSGQAQEKINWLTMEELEKAHDKEPRKVIIDMYTDWCGWCKRMDKTTFQHPEIAKYVNEHYYAVKFDAEQKDTVHFKGRDYVFVPSGRRGYHELAGILMNGKLSYPTIVYLDEELGIIQPVPGYQDPLSFEQIITYLAEDHHKLQPFEQYKKNYQARLSAKK